MATRAERRRTRWRSAAAIPGVVLVVGSLAVAQDPAPAPAPSPAAQNASTAPRQVEELEARLQQVEEDLRTTESELSRLRWQSDVHSVVSFATGGERWPQETLADFVRRQQLEAEWDQLTAERDEVRRALFSARIKSGSISAVDFLDLIEGRTAPGTGDLVDTTASPPAAIIGTHLSADIPALFQNSARFTIFTTAPPTGQEEVDAWFEFQRDENEAPVSGRGTIRYQADRQFSIGGFSVDQSAVLSGDIRVDLNSDSDGVARGTGQLRFVASTGVTTFFGNVLSTRRYDGRNGAQAPSLNLTTSGVGGPVIRDRQFFFFDRTGRKIAQGSGAWTYGGGPGLTFRSERPVFELTLNYSRDRATVSFEPGPGAGGAPAKWSIDVNRLFDRTPSFWTGPVATREPRLSRTWDPSAMAASVAKYYTATGGAAPAARPLEARVGLAYGSIANVMNGALDRTTTLLNPPAVNALRADTASQFGAGRLVTAAAQGQARTSPPVLLASRLADAVRGVLAARHAMRGEPPPFASTSPPPSAMHNQRGQAEPAAPVVYFRSLGRSTGPDAIEMTYIGDAPLAPGLDNLLVLEPVTRSEAGRVGKEMANAARGRPVVTMKLVMYCLNQRLLTPAPGQIMRLASATTHEKFMHVLSIWNAADRAHREGTLTPDSDPEDYYHSIVQWAIWTREQGFDQRAFGDAFAQHTRKNLEQAGQAWSGDVESVVRSVVPNRWRDIQTVLR